MTARLTNAVDEGLARRGMLANEHVKTYEAEALVDTGAVRTVIPADVASRLGLAALGHEVVRYPDSRKDVVSVTGPLTVEVAGRRTFEDALVLGEEVLIGQTVLEKLDLVVDCQGRRVVPNPAHPDQAITRV